MQRMFGMVVLAGMSLGGLSSSALAGGFDPRQPCNEILDAADETTLAMIGAWTFGYLASKQSETRPVDLDNVGTILGNISKSCKAKGGVSLLELVGGSAKAPAEQPAEMQHGSEAEARALLMRFFAPDADLEALTAALFPTEAEVHMVYKDPLASKMYEGYVAAFKPGIKFGPKPGQDELIVVYTTTAKLQRGDAALQEFPGGYKKVLQYFKTNVPIVRFKFVKSGETSGYAFDGLVYVNDHWVIMPKPWRALN